MSNFSTMTVAELKSYANDNNLDLGDAKRKSEIIAKLNGMNAKIEQVFVGSDKIVTEKRVPKSATKANENNVTTVSTADTFANKVFDPTPKVDDSKIAIYSEKNMHWNGIGAVSKGYNIVTEEAAAKWLTRKGIRKATPQELASHYGL